MPFWDELPDPQSERVTAETVVKTLPAENPVAKAYASKNQLGDGQNITAFVLSRGETYHHVHYENVRVGNPTKAAFGEPVEPAGWERKAHAKKEHFAEWDDDDLADMGFETRVALFLQEEAGRSPEIGNRFVFIGGAGATGHSWLPASADPENIKPTEDFKIQPDGTESALTASEMQQGMENMADTMRKQREQLKKQTLPSLSNYVTPSVSKAIKNATDNLASNTTVSPGEYQKARNQAAKLSFRNGNSMAINSFELTPMSIDSPDGDDDDETLRKLGKALETKYSKYEPEPSLPDPDTLPFNSGKLKASPTADPTAPTPRSKYEADSGVEQFIEKIRGSSRAVEEYTCSEHGGSIEITVEFVDGKHVTLYPDSEEMFRRAVETIEELQ